MVARRTSVPGPMPMATPIRQQTPAPRAPWMHVPVCASAKPQAAPPHLRNVAIMETAATVWEIETAAIAWETAVIAQETAAIARETAPHTAHEARTITTRPQTSRPLTVLTIQAPVTAETSVSLQVALQNDVTGRGGFPTSGQKNATGTHAPPSTPKNACRSIPHLHPRRSSHPPLPPQVVRQIGDATVVADIVPHHLHHLPSHLQVNQPRITHPGGITILITDASIVSSNSIAGEEGLMDNRTPLPVPLPSSTGSLNESRRVSTSISINYSY